MRCYRLEAEENAVRRVSSQFWVLLHSVRFESKNVISVDMCREYNKI